MSFVILKTGKKQTTLLMPTSKKEVRALFEFIKIDSVLVFSDIFQAYKIYGFINRNRYLRHWRPVLRNNQIFKIKNDQEIYSKYKTKALR